MRTITFNRTCPDCNGDGCGPDPELVGAASTCPTCDSVGTTPVELPARWEICGECDGNGAHSKDIGAITEEDRARDWSPEEFDSYMHGGYDRECGCCKGSGKVLVVDEDAVDDQQILKEWQESCRADEDYEAICAAERRMGC